MKKVVIFFLIILLVALPVAAFSINDFLTNFKEDIMGITGFDAFQVNFGGCATGDTRCNLIGECGGFPCVMTCQNNAWIEYEYCQDQCSEGECVNNGDAREIDLCTEGEKRCDTCNGNSCVMQCQNNIWIEYEYCQDQCSEGECVNNGRPRGIMCNDGTINNQCNPNLKYCNNGNLEENCNECGCITGKECVNNQCVENEPYDPGGEEDPIEDPNILNIKPLVSQIEDQITKIGKTFIFKIRAIDEDGDSLIYYFKEQKDKITTEIIECSILENIVSCKAIEYGDISLEIIVSDGKEEVITRAKIKVLKRLLLESKKGIAAGLINTPPTADAGNDITGTPGIPIILDASLSFDKEGIPSISKSYNWYENNQIIATGKTVEETFGLGTHSVTLEVKDSEGIKDTDTIKITIEPRETCKNTQTKYYPKDTICDSKWPTKEGDTFKINSITEGACSLFEVCDESVDPIIEESIKCCTEGLTDSEKTSTCNFANENSETFRNCQAIYIINGIGGSAIYMDGYFDAEMCCYGVDVLCPSEDYLYTTNPLPSKLEGKGLKCSNTPDNNPNGKWKSDTNTALNEIALADLPSHVNLNELGTGTCVDYSVSATTLLRKIGFSKESSLTVEAGNHAYNLIRFDLDKKFTIFDGTGNNRGLKLGYVPKGYDYCANILNCYNDMGEITCPSNKEIHGCENIEENIGRTTGRQVEGVKGTLQNFWEKIWGEITR